MAKATRLSRITILGGMDNLCKSDGTAISDYSPRIREFGGGRKLLEEKDPTLLTDLELLIEPATLGDPESPLKWTSKSVAKLAAGLNQPALKVFIIYWSLLVTAYNQIVRLAIASLTQIGMLSFYILLNKLNISNLKINQSFPLIPRKKN